MNIEERNLLIEQHLCKIYKLADLLRPRLPSYLDKEDLVSAGVLQLLTFADRFEPSRAAFWTFAERYVWGGMIEYARRECRQMCGVWPRGGPRIRPVPAESIRPTQELEVIEAQRFDQLQAEINELPARDRRVIELRLKGEKPPVIAKELGVPTGTVPRITHYSVKKLRERIAA